MDRPTASFCQCGVYACVTANIDPLTLSSLLAETPNCIAMCRKRVRIGAHSMRLPQLAPQAFVRTLSSIKITWKLSQW